MFLIHWPRACCSPHWYKIASGEARSSLGRYFCSSQKPKMYIWSRGGRIMIRNETQGVCCRPRITIWLEHIGRLVLCFTAAGWTLPACVAVGRHVAYGPPPWHGTRGETESRISSSLAACNTLESSNATPYPWVTIYLLSTCLSVLHSDMPICFICSVYLF